MSNVTFITKIKNFSKAIYNYIKSGFKKVSKKEYKRRLSICSSCESINSEKQECKICGCRLLMKAKWKTEKCPKEKWDPLYEEVEKE